jgi:hypothetical protein
MQPVCNKRVAKRKEVRGGEGLPRLVVGVPQSYSSVGVLICRIDHIFSFWGKRDEAKPMEIGLALHLAFVYEGMRALRTMLRR